MLEVRPRGVRSEYAPVLYLEPKTPANAAAVGFDMLSKPTRRDALERSMETGEPVLSAPVHLIQDGPIQATGLLLYLPVYKSGTRPATRSARRLAMQGWVYVPIRVNGYVRSALGQHRESRFRIYDVGSGQAQLLYGTPDEGGAKPAFRHSTTFEQYGRQWRVDYESPPLTVAAPRLQGLQNMLALGLFSSLLLYAIAWMLARTEAQAYRIAMRMTEDYRRSEQRFRSAMRYSAIGKALLDSEGCIVEANPALSAIVGLPMETLTGMRFDALFESDEQRDRAAEAVPREWWHLATSLR